MGDKKVVTGYIYGDFNYRKLPLCDYKPPSRYKPSSKFDSLWRFDT